jgi:Cu-Zn family superoxide dismutase
MFKLIAVLSLTLASQASAEIAVAQIKGTAEGSKVAGTARLEDVKGGLKVTLNLTGLPGTVHAVHIHEFGDCGDAGKAAGSHYNPEGGAHGNALKDPKHAHPGDLGNLQVEGGAVVFEGVLKRASLYKKNPVAGRAVVLHEKADDFGQPVGNAGGRIACGLISVVGK